MNFILVPGTLSATKVRQLLAVKNQINCRVGTFSTLLEVMQELWLLPAIDDNFDDLLRQEALSANNSFWSQSIQVDEVSVLAQLKQSLFFMLESLPLNEKFKKISARSSSSPREANYYNQLLALFDSMGSVRPAQQQIAMNWLNQSQLPSLDRIQVYYLAENFSFSVWQQQLLVELDSLSSNSTDNLSIDKEVQAILETAFESQKTRKKDLNYLRASLFTPKVKNEAIKLNNIKFIRLRDSLLEIETIASSIQYAIKNGESYNNFAIVVPDNSDYLDQTLTTLNHAGILSSNQQSSETTYAWHTQLIKDLIEYFIANLIPIDGKQQLVPNMLISALLSNPCMPWSIRQGQKLAQNINDACSEYNMDMISGKDLELYELLINVKQNDCFDWIIEIAPLLNLRAHLSGIGLNQLLEDINNLKEQSQLYNDKEPIEVLIKISNQITPSIINLAESSNTNILNGISVLTESEWLLQSVKHLYLLGFNQGNYIPKTVNMGVFSRNGFIANQLQLKEAQQSYQQLFENRFKQLINCATESLTFFISEQSNEGENLLLSETLFDISLSLQAKGNINHELLVQNIDDPKANFTHKISKIIPLAFRIKHKIKPDTFSFDLNLLALHKDKDKKPRKESPSSLEKMIISPFAWLLSRQGFTAKGWKIETIDVGLKGTIAHKVFELQFDKKHKTSSCNDLFQEALETTAPHLLHPYWKMERIQLLSEIEKALLPFIQWCQSNKWKVVKSEEHLYGKLWTINLHGFADIILKKGKHYLVLDYKKSKSEGRKKRLDNGYDLQTKIYSSLYKQQLNDQNLLVSSGYYTLNDQTLLLDFTPGQDTQNIEYVLVDNLNEAQSAKATILIKEQIKSLKKGIVKLNTEEDKDRWDKLGVAAKYTLDDAPIVQYFYST